MVMIIFFIYLRYGFKTGKCKIIPLFQPAGKFLIIVNLNSKSIVFKNATRQVKSQPEG